MNDELNDELTDDFINDFLDDFSDYTKKIHDPRIERTKLHPINEIMLIAFLGTICLCDGWRSLERYGKEKIDFLRRFYEFKNEIPSDDTFRRFFKRVSPKGCKAFFQEWVQFFGVDRVKLIAIDGKTSRSSIKDSGRQLNTVSAYASENHIVLAQQKANDKSNEITAIPKLLDLIKIKNATVTIDAAGCQRNISQKIIDAKGDYCIAVKGNQESLFNAVIEEFDAISNDRNRIKKTSSITTEENGHGRKEKRIYETISIEMNEKLQSLSWPGLKSIVKVTSYRSEKGKETVFTRYYISSSEPNAQKASKTIRSHWAIENNLHWVLDTTFKDDESKIKKGNAAENMMIIKHLALNLIKRFQKKGDSIKGIRQRAAWNNETLLKILRKIYEV